MVSVKAWYVGLQNFTFKYTIVFLNWCLEDLHFLMYWIIKRTVPQRGPAQPDCQAGWRDLLKVGAVSAATLTFFQGTQALVDNSLPFNFESSRCSAVENAR